MFSKGLACLGLVVIGLWATFFAEQIEAKADAYHQRIKRKGDTTRFMLKLTSSNLRRPIRLLGLAALAAAAFLLFSLVHDLERGRL